MANVSTDFGTYFGLLERINRLSDDDCDYGKLVDLYHDLIEGLATEVMTTKIQELYFRARRNLPEKPQNTSEIGPPPADVVKGFQRCNAPGRPAFYSSSKRSTAILEIRPKSGETIYLSQWQSRKSLPVNIILQPLNQKLVRGQDSIPQALLHAHVDTLFSQRIHEDFSHDYRKSSALAEVLTTRFEHDKNLSVHNDGCIGLRYPSIFDRIGSYNTVFPAHFVDARIYPIHLIEAKVNSVSENQVDLEILDTAVDFEAGKILWTGDRASIPVAYEGRGIRLRSNGKKLLVDVRSTLATPNEIKAFLEEDFGWEYVPVPGQPLPSNLTQFTALTPTGRRFPQGR